jgi:hypothetical protein
MLFTATALVVPSASAQAHHREEHSSNGGACSGRSSNQETASAPRCSQTHDDLVVEYDAGDGSPQQRWTLTCGDPVTGNHPQAQQACEHLASLEDPFAPLPADQYCAQEWSGPQQAHVTGRWDASPVDLHLLRGDACQTAQWDSLVPLVPDVWVRSRCTGSRESGTIAEELADRELVVSPLTENPEGDGVISGTIKAAGEGTEAEWLTNEIGCLIDFVVDDEVTPLDP